MMVQNLNQNLNQVKNNGNKEPTGGDNKTENSGGVDLDNGTEE